MAMPAITVGFKYWPNKKNDTIQTYYDEHEPDASKTVENCWRHTAEEHKRRQMDMKVLTINQSWIASLYKMHWAAAMMKGCRCCLMFNARWATITVSVKSSSQEGRRWRQFGDALRFETDCVVKPNRVHKVIGCDVLLCEQVSLIHMSTIMQRQPWTGLATATDTERDCRVESPFSDQFFFDKPVKHTNVNT